MLAWRLCRRRYANLDGLGAGKVGGRWNPAGAPLVYMSSSDALAVLEVRVHLRHFIPETYVFVSAEIPDNLIERIENQITLATDWRDNIEWTRSAGKRFLDEQWSLGLSVPSRIVPAGRNILLNPAHCDFGSIIVNPPQPFEWDRRLWERTLEAFRAN